MIRKVRGSLTVEAAIVIPFIIIIMLPFLYILRSLYVYDCVRTAVFESTQTLQNILYLTNVAEDLKEGSEIEEEGMNEEAQEAKNEFQSLVGILDEATGGEGVSGLTKNLALQEIMRFLVIQLTEKQNLEAWGLIGGSERISYFRSKFLYDEEEQTALISVSAVYDFEFPFVRRFAKMEPVEIICVGRAFVGKETQEANRFNKSTETGDLNTKYRIGNGEHYHTLDCYLIDKDLQMMFRDHAIEQGYYECKGCTPVSDTVVVTKGGDKYHEKNCRYIAPELTPLSEEEIEKSNYSPCEICIGGGGWFR